MFDACQANPDLFGTVYAGYHGIEGVLNEELLDLSAQPKVGLELVADSERTFPKEWIAGGRLDVTEDFVRYARPLIGDSWPQIPLEDGRQRFAQLQPLFTQQKLPAYIPQANRR